MRPIELGTRWLGGLFGILGTFPTLLALLERFNRRDRPPRITYFLIDHEFLGWLSLASLHLGLIWAVAVGYSLLIGDRTPTRLDIWMIVVYILTCAAFWLR